MGFDTGANYKGGGKTMPRRRYSQEGIEEAADALPEFQGLAAQLDAAHARIKELEAQAQVRPVTVRTMKADIANAIGVELSGGDYKYCCTVSRSDLEKIHAYVMKTARLSWVKP